MTFAAPATCGNFARFKPPAPGLVLETRRAQPLRIDLLEAALIDTRACADARLLQVQVASSGRAVLYLLVNGQRANRVGAIVNRPVGQIYWDHLYPPRSYPLFSELETLELEIRALDESRPDFVIHSVEVILD